MLSRIIIGGLCVCGLVAVFLFQRIDVAGFLGVEAFIHKFLINRTFRFLLNDAFAIGLIYALFQERSMLFFLCMSRWSEWSYFYFHILCLRFTGHVTTVRLFLFCIGLF